MKNKPFSVRRKKSSIKRIISSTYIVVYIIVCLFVVSYFVMADAYNRFKELESYTPVLTEDIALASEKVEITSYEFRYYLNNFRNINNIKEIYILDNSNNIITGTSMRGDAIADYLENSTIISEIAPNLCELGKGYYLDFGRYEYVSMSQNMHIVICYDAKVVINNVLNSAKDLAVMLIMGSFVFVFAGYARMSKILRPIDNITQVTKKINGQNMDLRIDVDSMEFELNELAGTINSMMDRIQLSYDKQKRFVSDVSHELRTPIAVISGYGSMLKRWGKSDESILDESIEAIISESDNMKDLVEKLLFLTRHDNDTISFDMSDVNISELTVATVKEEVMVHPDFTFNLRVKEGIVRKADTTRFKQAIRIFLDNAVKYSGSSKTIDIVLSEDENGIMLSIRDYGIGISKEDLPNIFERFYRADTSRTKETGGYGLGLSIAKIIVNNHGGYIKVRTKENEGSEFSILLK